MMAMTLALRNIAAHARRNAIVATVVALVSAALFLVLAFSDGELENIKYGLSTFWYSTSDIRVVRDDYRELLKRGEDDSRESTVPGYETVRDSLKKYPFVSEAYAYAWRGGASILAAGEKYLYYTFRYVDFGNEEYLTSRYSVEHGRNFLPGDRNAILLHEAVRSLTPMREGDLVKVSGTDFFGQVFSQEVTVIGFYKPGVDNPNLMTTALCDDSVRSAVTGYAAGEMNGIEIRLAKGADAKAAVAALNGEWKSGAGKGMTAYTGKDIRGTDGNEMVYGLFRLILVAICLIVIGIVSFGIMNVVSVNLFDRKKEIGTYYCLGSEKPFLTRMYTWEILIVNILGTVAGIGLGLIARAGINALKITSTDPGTQLVLGGSVFKLGFSLSTVLYIVGGIAVLTALTALTTLGSALKVSPVEAIRETE